MNNFEKFKKLFGFFVSGTALFLSIIMLLSGIFFGAEVALAFGTLLFLFNFPFFLSRLPNAVNIMQIPDKFTLSLVDCSEREDYVKYCKQLLWGYGFKIEKHSRFVAQGVDFVAIKGGIKYAVACVNYTTDVSPIVGNLCGISRQIGCRGQIVMSNHYFVGYPLQSAAGQFLNNAAYQLPLNGFFANAVRGVFGAIGRATAPSPILIDRSGMYEMMKRISYNSYNEKNQPALALSAKIFPPLPDGDFGTQQAISFAGQRITEFFASNGIPLKIHNVEVIENLVMFSCHSLANSRLFDIENKAEELAEYLGNKNVSITTDVMDETATICAGLNGCRRMAGL